MTKFEKERPPQRTPEEVIEAACRVLKRESRMLNELGDIVHARWLRDFASWLERGADN